MGRSWIFPQTLCNGNVMSDAVLHGHVQYAKNSY